MSEVDKYYYKVWVSSPKFHKDTLLTYSYHEPLEIGTTVVIPLVAGRVPALVAEKTKKPKFKTKPISRSISPTPAPVELLELANWLGKYYPAPKGQIMSLFIHSSLTSSPKKVNVENFSKRDIKPAQLPSLTEEQRQVVRQLNENPGKPSILHGDTGSGKTRVYLEIIRKTIDSGRSAILLVPEIGLTPQLAQESNAAFPRQTIVVHSRLTPAEKRDTWLKILESTEPIVIVGARSALFSPVKNLGAIIIDEFHESSYKQEQAPHYLTSRVAAKLANLHDAQLILGSATPLVADYYAFTAKKLPILRMKEQAAQNVKKVNNTANEQKNIEIVDIKQRDLFSRSKWLCNDLISDISDALNKKEQSLVFLNRRGTARLVMCGNCGWQEVCPNCDLPLTYHADTHKTVCHTCGYEKNARSSCPSCGSSDIIFRSIGTKALVTELGKLFPLAKIKRFDSDLGKKDRLEGNYQQLKSGDFDIVVGTQMVGKGLDLPKLSVLGVVTADTSLSFPDYTSAERTYQLITQVLGRINRGHLKGRAYVQTYHPNNKIIIQALDKDYEDFYRCELEERKKYYFPPYCYTLKISCSYAKREKSEAEMQKLAKELLGKINNIEISGPSPKFIEKAAGKYRWHLIVKSIERNRLVNIAKQLPTKWSYDIDPVNLL